MGYSISWKRYQKNTPILHLAALPTLKSIKSMADEYVDATIIEIDSLNIPKLDTIEDNLESEELPIYKRYSSKESISKYCNNIQHNALNNLARSALVTADLLISKELSGDSLNEHINNHTLDKILDKAFHKGRGLKFHIKKCLDGFNQNYPDIDRNRKQAVAAKELSDEEVMGRCSERACWMWQDQDSFGMGLKH